MIVSEQCNKVGQNLEILVALPENSELEPGLAEIRARDNGVFLTRDELSVLVMGPDMAMERLRALSIREAVFVVTLVQGNRVRLKVIEGGLKRDLALWVDERTREKLASTKIAGMKQAAMDVNSLADYLSRMCLDRTGQSAYACMQQDQDKLRLLCPGFYLKLSSRDGVIHVDGVGRGGYFPDAVIIKGDHSFTLKPESSVLSQQEQEIVMDPSSLLNLWARANQEETGLILDDFLKTGVVPCQWFEKKTDKTLRVGLFAGDWKKVKDIKDFMLVSPGDGQTLVQSIQGLKQGLGLKAIEDVFRGLENKTELQKKVHGRMDGEYRMELETPNSLPDKISACSLIANIKGDLTRLKRREQAWEKLRTGMAPLTGLMRAIEGKPADWGADRIKHVPPEVINKVFRHGPPTPAQLRAVRAAINTPDLVAIQGPPGTGKTTVIVAIIETLKYLAQKEGRTGIHTLITSYQHVAVENALDRVENFGLPVLKVGTRSGEDQVQQVLGKVDEWSEQVVDSVKVRFPDVLDKVFEVDTLKSIDKLLGRAFDLDRYIHALDAIRNRLFPFIPRSLDKELQDLIRDLKQEWADAAGNPELARVVRGLRTRSLTWSDDGPARVTRVLVRLNNYLGDSDKRLLQSLRSKDMPERQDFEDLAGLKMRLLLKLAPRPHVRWLPIHRPGVDDVLTRVRRVVQTAMEQRADRVVDLITAFYVQRMGHSLGELREAVLAYSGQVGATVQQAAGHTMSEVMEGGDWLSVIIDEAGRAQPSDLVVPMVRARRRVVLVGDHKQLPHMVDERLMRAMEKSDDMTHEEIEIKLKESMFQRVYKAYEDTPRAVMLDEQFRMHPLLGELISEVFYDGKLKSPLPEKFFRHEVKVFGKPGPMAWVDVAAGRHKRQGTSLVREAEAEVLVEKLKAVLDDPGGKGLKIGVITFYSAQRDLIMGLAESAGVADAVEIGTVDAFQGREFDIVFLSPVRAGLDSKFGFLKMQNRLNVALSRARRMVVVVGDHALYASDRARDKVPGLRRFAGICMDRGWVHE